MDEKIKNPERNKLKTGEKLEWETPKLICLDKGKTEGGPVADTESYTGDLS